MPFGVAALESERLEVEAGECCSRGSAPRWFRELDRRRLRLMYIDFICGSENRSISESVRA
jgi:hypothetical protein